jgi:hypothetical protein
MRCQEWRDELETWVGVEDVPTFLLGTALTMMGVLLLVAALTGCG